MSLAHHLAQDHLGTERLAEQESESRTTDTTVLIAAVARLGTVVLAIVRSSSANDLGATAAVILSVLAGCCRGLVNTVFALKYARLYYLEEDGGIDFKQTEPPAYSGFAYLAFRVGMAFGVSEAEPTNTTIRKVALEHALLSFLFSTGILAVAINLISTSHNRDRTTPPNTPSRPATTLATSAAHAITLTSSDSESDPARDGRVRPRMLSRVRDGARQDSGHSGGR